MLEFEIKRDDKGFMAYLRDGDRTFLMGSSDDLSDEDIRSQLVEYRKEKLTE